MRRWSVCTPIPRKLWSIYGCDLCRPAAAAGLRAGREAEGRGALRGDRGVRRAAGEPVTAMRHWHSCVRVGLYNFQGVLDVFWGVFDVLDWIEWYSGHLEPQNSVQLSAVHRPPWNPARLASPPASESGTHLFEVWKKTIGRVTELFAQNS